MSESRVDELVQNLTSLSNNPPQDSEQRERLKTAAQRLAWSLESPHDTIYRVLYGCAILPVAHVASNLQIFSTLSEHNGAACTVEQLAAARGADVTLTGRIARWLAGHGMIDEFDEGQFAANNVTRALSVPGFAAGIKHYMYTSLPPLQALPAFLEGTSYANPSDLYNAPFQKALDTKLSKFEWQASQPELREAFGRWMAAQHSRQMTWLNVLNFADFTKNATSETPVFVDVGGGIGHQCALLREHNPDLVGRVILQDSAKVLENALSIAGLEKMPHDFWTEQPVKGSRVYYFRYIMHDYPDDRCRIILEHTRAEMNDESVIFIDDVVLPEKGAHPHSLDKDIVMMVNFAAMERTEKQWKSLFESCGLRLLKAATYNSLSGETIQVVGKA